MYDAVLTLFWRPLASFDRDGQIIDREADGRIPPYAIAYGVWHGTGLQASREFGIMTFFDFRFAKLAMAR